MIRVFGASQQAKKTQYNWIKKNIPTIVLIGAPLSDLAWSIGNNCFLGLEIFKMCGHFFGAVVVLDY